MTHGQPDRPRTSRKNTRFEAEGAEFLVLGRLLIEGIPTYKTYTNVPGYDLVATSPSGGRIATIQVKSRWAMHARQFGITKIAADFFALVRLNRGDRERGQMATDPEYFVMPADTVRALAGDNDRWRHIPWSEEAFEKHRDRWDLIGQFLKVSHKRKLAKVE
jgi:hypothetical protein